jgi:hypothetical protein
MRSRHQARDHRVTEPYKQHLPDLDLSIERYTDTVPKDGAWYLLQAGRQLARYRSLKAAQEAWKALVQESGWTPSRREVNPAEVRRREQKERWARNRAG